MKTIIQRVIKWNSDRYSQEYNSDLNQRLLLEELAELCTADKSVSKALSTGTLNAHMVERIDALCDMIYIAIGAMWKSGLTSDQIEQCLIAVCDANDTKVAVKTASNVKANLVKGDNFVAPEAKIWEILFHGPNT